ncbi:hypothetical protein [Paraburkholderia phenazinium]|uniref:hypothetical protein n=1 Tax=Paraburkholderia phenazinium TaxID=60549 RepID=UPI00158C0AF1|nr:hypothetical protein [Paraburkholderia phenazinium]
MGETLLGLFSAVVSDRLSADHIAAASTLATSATEMLKTVMRRRHAVAADILSEELREGTRTLDEADLPEAAAILYRYQRAAEEGAAKLNLRLLAAVFAGQSTQKSIAADDFLYLADILAPLKREEVILLGTFLKLHPRNGDVKAPRDVYAAVVEELVPAVFESGADFRATAGALLRTGLLVANVPPATYGSGGNGLYYESTNLLFRLNGLADIEGVVYRSDAAANQTE